MARMTASASSDPLDPLPFRAGDAAGAEPGVEGGPAEAGVSSPTGRGGRDRRGRGLRHVTARVERIPDRLDERLRELHAGRERDEEALFARAERQGRDGVLITLFERPLRDAADPADLEGAVYGVALSRCADALGVDPQVLDPSWGRG